jgi:2-methylcitrate dehydratase PrpD
VLRVPEQHLAACNIADPTTGLEAKFSLRFAAAQALVSGVTDESSFTDEAVTGREVREMWQRVEVVGDADLGIYDTVAIVSGERGERTLVKNTATPRWVAHPDEQTDLLARKFRSLVEPVLGETATEALIDAVMTLDEEGTATTLMTLVRPSVVSV